MKIALNYTHYVKGQVGGMGDYMMALLYYLPKISPKDEFYVIHIPTNILFSKIPNLHSIQIKKPNSSSELTASLLKCIQANKFDLWYSPLLVLDPYPCPIPSVFNIPDMQHEYFPHYFDSSTLTWRKKEFANSTRYSNGIITLSKNSKMDITRLLDINPKQVYITYLDASLQITKIQINTSEILKKYNLKNKRYLYYPANTWPHKNHERLIEAFSRISNKYPSISLVFTGFSYDNWNQIKNFIIKFNLIKEIRILNYINAEEVISLYKNSLGLVFPSLFEGFGIPLVEAMKLGCPIVCSNATSIPEVAQQSALYFDPLSVSDIANKLDLFLGNSRLRLKLIKEGEKQGKHFSYENTAKQTLDIFKDVIKNHKKSLSFIPLKTWPKISIVTPSYNQGRFIERTIKSVLSQNYPNLQYIVIDGGSTDNTLEILKKYSDKITWVSEKDNGQTDAINKGLRMATGEIVAYLNSDDTYEPNSLKTVASFFENNTEEVFVYGIGKHIDEKNKFIENYPNAPTDYSKLHGPCTICQPTAFWKRTLIDQIGYFDDKLRYAMDYDYWIRISKKYRLNFIPNYLGNTRLYAETKTLGQRTNVHREIIKVQQKHYKDVNAHWIFALVHTELKNESIKGYYFQVKFNLTLIIKSLYYFLYYNHHFPPKSIFKLYYIWLRDIIKAPYHKIKYMLFK